MSKSACVLFLLFGLSASLKIQKRDDVWSSRASPSWSSLLEEARESQGWQTVEDAGVQVSEISQREDLLDLMIATGAKDHAAAHNDRTEVEGDIKEIEKDLEDALQESARTVRTARIQSKASGSYGLVWIHGAGFYNWKPLMDKYLQMPNANLSITYPQSPTAKVQAWGGSSGLSWFDMKFLPIGANNHPPLYGCNLEDAKKNTAIVHQSIQALEMSGIPADKIVVAGMSQGGYMTLRAALTYPKKLGGAFVYAGMLMDIEELKQATTDANKDTPIEWLHGTKDDVLLTSMQKKGVDELQQAGFNVAKTTCSAHHTSHPALYEHLGAFMNKLMSA